MSSAAKFIKNMYRVQATIYKHGQCMKDLNTIQEAKKLVKHCINWLKKAREGTIMRVEITNLNTGEIIEAWSNCECKIPFKELEKEIKETMKKIGKTATPPSHYDDHI